MFELERSCPTAGHWTLEQYEQALQSDAGTRFCLVAEAEAAPVAGGTPSIVGLNVLGLNVLGFLVARNVHHEWELENIVVASASRRTGLGMRLLEELLTQVRETRGESVFLEVRESNTPARKLYEKLGFQQTSRRKSYYSNPQEDAVVYTWKAEHSVDH
jgi:ribosomal-protein-alanine acetyltransferase